VIKVDRKERVIIFDYTRCILCAQCATSCPSEAITMSRPPEIIPGPKKGEYVGIFRIPAPPPKPAPKPAEKAPPVYEQWKSVGTKNWNDQKPIVTGYTASSDRYWASLHVQNAPDVPAANWNDQKAIVTGYTQPGDKYFATRQRLAYHPRDKTFQPEIAASVSGSASTQTAPPPPPPPPPQPESKPQVSSGKKSRQQELEEFEKEYLVRREQEQQEAEEAAVEEVAEVASKKGALPKGF
jgi:ferredoxin